jgi:hypothetical protein
MLNQAIGVAKNLAPSMANGAIIGGLATGGYLLGQSIHGMMQPEEEKRRAAAQMYARGVATGDTAAIYNANRMTEEANLADIQRQQKYGEFDRPINQLNNMQNPYNPVGQFQSMEDARAMQQLTIAAAMQNRAAEQNMDRQMRFSGMQNINQAGLAALQRRPTMMDAMGAATRMY